MYSSFRARRLSNLGGTAIPQEMEMEHPRIRGRRHFASVVDFTRVEDRRYSNRPSFSPF
jgi:hypothetical protein